MKIENSIFNIQYRAADRTKRQEKILTEDLVANFEFGDEFCNNILADPCLA